MVWSEKVRRVRGVYSGVEGDSEKYSDKEVVQAAAAKVAEQNERIAEDSRGSDFQRSAMEDGKRAACPLCGYEPPGLWFIDIDKLPYYPTNEIEIMSKYLELRCDLSKKVVSTLRPQTLAHLWNGHLGEDGALHSKYETFRNNQEIIRDYQIMVQDRENGIVEHVHQLEKEGKIKQAYDLIAALRFHSAAIDDFEGEHPIMLGKIRPRIRTPNAELKRLFKMLPDDYHFNPKSNRRTAIYEEPKDEWEYPPGYDKP